MSKVKQFEDVTSMFSTSENTDAVKGIETSKTINHSTKRTKKARESRSQRKQFLFTKTTSNNLKMLAMVQDESENEIVNRAVESYIKKEFRKDPTLKPLAEKLLNKKEDWGTTHGKLRKYFC